MNHDDKATSADRSDSTKTQTPSQNSKSLLTKHLEQLEQINAMLPEWLENNPEPRVADSPVIFPEED